MHLRLLAASILALVTATAHGNDVLITLDGKPLFPIGFYELPQNDAGLEAWRRRAPT